MLVSLVYWIEQVLSHFSYAGVFFLMFVDSVNIPVPSEVTLAFTGFLVQRGVMNLHLSAIVCGLGGLAGSLVSYAIAYVGGRPIMQRYGKYLLIHSDDVRLAERWFERHGEWLFLFGRFIPVVRTFISFPAGLLRVRLIPFGLYAFFGSLVWSYLFILVGVFLGDRWSVIEPLMERFQWAVMGAVVLGIVWHVHRHVKKRGKLIAQ